ncbi:hypothetical protein NFI96_000697 [Prochilodus magdalenae]|nr:hypothetical protein NFI96_000697 [Prochilodus magdalenae]
MSHPVSTIGRRLHNTGLHACGQSCQTVMSSECQQVIFSDESRLCLGGDDQRIGVWRLRGQRQDDRGYSITLSGSTLCKDLRLYLSKCFTPGSMDSQLQQVIRENLYLRAVP